MITNQKALCFTWNWKDSKSMQSSVAIPESQVCEDYGIPYFLFGYSGKDKGKIFDRFKRPIISLKGYDILTRSGYRILPKVIKSIEDLNGKNILTSRENEIILNWPSFVSPKYTKRNIKVTSLKDIEEKIDDFTDDYGYVFAKSREKTASGWGTVMPKASLLEVSKKGLPYRRSSKKGTGFVKVPSNIEMIVSEPVDIKSEYRIAIVNNKIVHIMNNNILPGNRGRFKEIPRGVYDFSEDFIEEHKGILPEHYSLDAGFTQDRGYLVVELNTLNSAGFSKNDKRIKQVFSKILEEITN